MAESNLTTYEEACLCPKCGRPGEVRRKQPARNRRNRPVEVHHVFCTTELCRWYNTEWIVQVNEDGSIPQAYSSALEAKLFPKISQESETRLREAMEAQIAAETQPGGGEVRNPYRG